ncbi:ABC transporter ATP-binding protein [soil metagenome]
MSDQPGHNATSLSLRGISKSYGDAVAVAPLTLRVEAGRLLTLLGPSGCGKTTTLKLIAGLLAPDAGRIYFGDKDVTALPPERRNLGMVFQRYALFPHLNVEQNVSFGLRMRGLDKHETRRRVAEVLETVELTGFERRFPNSLSGGQQQRVAIARTVVTRPEVLLLDEPLSNLDASLREGLRGFIRSLQQRLGITTVFVTHDQHEALELSDTVGVMLAGRLQQLGTPQEVYERPRSEAVARFMGVGNLLKVGKVREGGGLVETELGWLRTAQTDFSGEAGWLTIRPEQVALALPDLEPAPNSFDGVVRAAKYRGNMVLYDVVVGDTVLSASSSTHLSSGDYVTVTLPARDLWLVRDEKPLKTRAA